MLGDGYQRKSYLHVSDCARAMLHVIDRAEAAKAPHRTAIFNLGTEEYCRVRESVGWICERLAVSPRLKFSDGRCGWVGDNPFIWLDTSRIRATGWRPQYSIREGVECTLDWLCANLWVLPARRFASFGAETTRRC